MRILIAAFAVMLAGVAQAQNGNFYVGLEAGATHFSSSSDDDEFMAGIRGGYQFNPNLRVELGVRSLMTDESQGRDSYGFYKEEFNISSYQLSAIGLLPLTNNVRLFGRAGVALMHAEYEESYRDYDYYGWYSYDHYSESETKGVLFGGVGIEADIWSRLSATVEYSHYAKFLGTQASTLAVGVNWNF
jgi:hypothetical protein